MASGSSGLFALPCFVFVALLFEYSLQASLFVFSLLFVSRFLLSLLFVSRFLLFAFMALGFSLFAFMALGFSLFAFMALGFLLCAACSLFDLFSSLRFFSSSNRTETYRVQMRKSWFLES